MDEKTIMKHFKKYKKQLVKEYGNKALFDYELDNIGKQLFGKKYKGTFSVDYTPKKSPKKQYFIINNKGKSHPGQHWLAVYKNNDIYYIYDSFGRNSKRIITPFIKGRKTIDSDHDKEQHIDEEICGILCMAWLKCVDEYGIRAALKI